MKLAQALLAAAFTFGIGSTSVSAQAPADFRGEFLGQFNASARKIVSLAQAMPEDTYAWRPGEGVASVSEVYMHIARYNLMYPDENLGVAPRVPSSEYGEWEAAVTTKADAVRILSESVEWVRTVVDGMSDADLEATTVLYGRNVQKWSVLLQLITHMNEHLGQSIAYARMNGVTPPWSR